jgi:hypothetical protein
VPVDKNVGNVPSAWSLVRGPGVVENGGLFSADFHTSTLSTISELRVSMSSDRGKLVAIVEREEHETVDRALLLSS